MPISKRRVASIKAKQNETMPLYSKSLPPTAKYMMRLKTMNKKQIMIGTSVIVGLIYLLSNGLKTPNLKVEDGIIGLLDLETCPIADRVYCDKNIISSMKRVRHKIPVLECKDHTGYLTNDVLCVQFDNTVSAAVVLEGKRGKHKKVLRRMRSSTEYNRAIEIFKSFGIVGESYTYHLAHKSVVAGMGFYLENDVGVDYRKNDGNKGNKLWEYAVLRMYNRFTTSLHHAYYMTNALKVEASGLVITSSSAFATIKALEPVFDASKAAMAEYTNVVVERDVPTMILGVGLVVDYNDYDKKTLGKLEFTPSQTKFLEAAAERGPPDASPNIAVYGKISQTICENSGVHSCIAMGCPSLTLSREPSLGKVLEKKWHSVINNIERGKKLDVVLVLPELNGEGFVGLGSAAFSAITNLYANICKRHTCSFVVQNEWTDKQYFLELDYAAEFVDESQFHLFSGEVDEWLDFVKEKDFVVSARIAGGMAGIATGVPSIIIPTDYRIEEAAEEMKVPIVTVKKIIERKYTAVIELMEDAEINFKDFEISRRDKISTYKGLINKSGLEMDPTDRKSVV